MACGRTSDIAALHAAARRLRARAKRPSWRSGGRLPALIFVTDPARTPAPDAIVASLPAGSAVVFRAFGSADAVEVGRRLKAIAVRRGLILLAGADEQLAHAIGAHGLHLPERLAARARAVVRRRPGWIVTAAAHSRRAALLAARAGAHAILVSPVFESASRSAGRPLGPTRFAALARDAHIPIFALGGVTLHNIQRLLGSGAVGIAAVDAFIDPNERGVRT